MPILSAAERSFDSTAWTLRKCVDHVLRAWVVEDGLSASRIMCDHKSNELSGLKTGPLEFCRIIRVHWQVANASHCVLDVTFNEDHRQVRDVQAAHTLCIMREMVTKVLKSNKAKGTVRSKCKRAAHDAAFRTAMLTQIP